MTALTVIGVIVAVLLLLSMVRLGGNVEYSADGLTVGVRCGSFRFHVYPAQKKEKKTKPDKKKKAAEKEKAAEEKRGGSLALVRRVLPLAGEAAGELKRKIRIDKLFLDLTVSGADAAASAMAFGYSNMLFGMIWPVFEQNFEVKDHRFRTAVDFNAESPVIYLNIAFSARLGQLVVFGARFGWKFLRIYMQEKKHADMKKEAI